MRTPFHHTCIVTAVAGLGDRSAVEVSDELSPLEEPAGCGFGLEGRTVGEDVGVFGLTRPTGSRCP